MASAVTSRNCVSASIRCRRSCSTLRCVDSFCNEKKDSHSLSCYDKKVPLVANYFVHYFANFWGNTMSHGKITMLKQRDGCNIEASFKAQQFQSDRATRIDTRTSVHYCSSFHSFLTPSACHCHCRPGRSRIFAQSDDNQDDSSWIVIETSPIDFP